MPPGPEGNAHPWDSLHGLVRTLRNFNPVLSLLQSAFNVLAELLRVEANVCNRHLPLLLVPLKRALTIKAKQRRLLQVPNNITKEGTVTLLSGVTSTQAIPVGLGVTPLTGKTASLVNGQLINGLVRADGDLITRRSDLLTVPPKCKARNVLLRPTNAGSVEKSPVKLPLHLPAE